MSYCKQTGPDGKDKIIFATEEDHKKPSTVVLPPADPAPGLILSNGDINWNCPCLGGMATGPCGVEFRTAFSCFHYSEKEPKGSECLETFQAMQDCMKKYPNLYKQSRSDDDEDEFSSFSAQGDDAAEQITENSNPAVDTSDSKLVEKASS